jgi:hypothetical protein
MRPAILQTDTLNQVVWAAPGRQPHFETFQLYLAHPQEAWAIALIFRLCATAQQSYGEVEAILIQPDRPPRRACQRWPLGRVQSDPERAGIGIAESSLQHNASQGLVRGDDFAISWDLNLADRSLGYAGLPAGWSPGGISPKLFTPHPCSHVLRGKIELWEGLSRHTPMHKIDLKGWHGMQGHWVQAPATQPYAWVHASQFEGPTSEPMSFEAFAGPLRLGPLVEPMALLGRLVVGGQTYRFDGWRNLFAGRPTFDAGSWSFSMQHRGAKLRGSVKIAGPAAVVAPRLDCTQPAGAPACSQQIAMLARLELIFEPPKGLPQTLISQRATYLTQTPTAAQ